MDKFLFDPSNYSVLRRLKGGAQGYILLVQEKKTMKKYVAKTNKNQEDNKSKSLFLREVNILIHINHPTIICFRGFSYQDFQGNNNITILMDYIENGSLRDLLMSERDGLCDFIYTNTNRQIILAGIAYGMMMLHKNNVIHRDLKPENILLDKNYFPIITDFGLSKFYDPYFSTEQSRCTCGTQEYMAPEVILGYDYNSKVDVFAFGIIMYEVITGQGPYENRPEITKLAQHPFHEKVINGLRPEFSTDNPIKEEIKNLIEKCWSKDIDKRPTFQELFQKLSLFYNTNEIQEINGNTCDFEDYCLDDVDTEELYNYIEEITVSNKIKNNKEELLQINEIFQQVLTLSPNRIIVEDDLPEESNNIIQIIKKEFPTDDYILSLSTKLNTLEFNDVLNDFHFTLNFSNIEMIYNERNLFNNKSSFEIFSIYVFYSFIPIYIHLSESKKFNFKTFLAILNHIIQICANDNEKNKYHLIAISCFVNIVNIAVEKNTIANYNDVVQEVSDFLIRNTQLPNHSDVIIKKLAFKIFSQNNELDEQNVNLIEKIIFISSQNPGVLSKDTINSIIQSQKYSIIGLNPLCLRLFLHFANSLKKPNFLEIMDYIIFSVLMHADSSSNFEGKNNDYLTVKFYQYTYNDLESLIPHDLYQINKITGLNLDVLIKSQNLFDYINPEMQIIVRIIERIINLKKIYAQNFILKGIQCLHSIELNIFEQKEDQLFNALKYVYYKQCVVALYLISSILKKFPNITLADEEISTLFNEIIFDPKITYFAQNSNFEIVNSLRDFIFKHLFDQKPQLFADLMHRSIPYLYLFRENLCRIISMYNDQKPIINESFSYLTDVLIESLAVYGANSSSSDPDYDYFIISIRKMLIQYLSSYLSNDSMLIKAFNSYDFISNFFILLIEPPIRQQFISFLEKYLLSKELNDMISTKQNIGVLTKLSDSFINLFEFCFKLQYQKEIISLLCFIVDILINTLKYNKKLIFIYQPIIDKIFDNFLNNKYISNEEEVKDIFSISVINLLAVIYIEYQITANDISLFESILILSMKPNLYQIIMDKIIQIIAKYQMTKISPTFIIKNHNILCSVVRAFLNTSFIYKVVSFISNLCSYSIENCQICHTSNLDILIINIIQEWRKSTISFIDTADNEVYIIKKENGVILNERLLELFLHLFTQISVVISSVPIVNNYFSLMCPIHCEQLSQIHKNILNTLNEILIKSNNIHSSNEIDENNQLQSFSYLLINYCNVDLIIPIFSEIDLFLGNNSQYSFLVNLCIEILSNLFKLGEKAQLSFFSCNGFFSISYLLQNSNELFITFDLYRHFYGLLALISNKNLQMQLIDTILMNINLWSRCKIHDKTQIFKHWNKELYYSFKYMIDLIRNSSWFLLIIHNYYESDDKFYVDCRNNLFCMAKSLSNANLPFNQLFEIIKYICLNEFPIIEKEEMLGFLLALLSNQQTIKYLNIQISPIISFILQILELQHKNDDIIIRAISIIITIYKYDNGIDLNKIIQKITISLLIDQKYLICKDMFSILITLMNSNYTSELLPFLCVGSILGNIDYLSILLKNIFTNFNYNLDIISSFFPVLLLYAFYSYSDFYPQIIKLLVNIFKENWNVFINSLNIIGFTGINPNIFDDIKHDVLNSIIHQPDIKKNDALNLIKNINDFIFFRPQNSQYSVLNHFISSYQCEIFTGAFNENESNSHEFKFNNLVNILNDLIEQKFRSGYKMSLRFDQTNGRWLDLDLAKEVVIFNARYNFTEFNEIMSIWSYFIKKLGQNVIVGTENLSLPEYKFNYSEFCKFSSLIFKLQQNHDQIYLSVLNLAKSFAPFYNSCENYRFLDHDNKSNILINDINKELNDKCYNSWKILGNSLTKIQAPWYELASKFTFNLNARMKTFCYAFCPFKLHKITNNNECNELLKDMNIQHIIPIINSKSSNNKEKFPNDLDENNVKKWIKLDSMEELECKLITFENEQNAILKMDNKSIFIVILDKGKIISIPSHEIDNVFYAFKNHKYIGLHIFTKLGSNYFLIFKANIFRNIPIRISNMQSINRDRIQNMHPKNFLDRHPMTSLWINGNISNFKYLMFLNILSGRSFYDASQYPIFPWVICDFSSSKLDLKNYSIFRDLSKPIGALDNKYLSELIRKRDESNEIERKSYLYESGYSNPSLVDYFLIRLEPFTTNHIKNNDGQFADSSKIFRSIFESYEKAKKNFFELIPEFFFCPEFLQNINKLNLGEDINDVELPPWANNSVFDFIYLHRKALESNYVSAHLDEWIDLIWGYKQDGTKALKANNTFRKEMYQDIWKDKNVNENEIINLQNKIGQIPLKLFDVRHPKRMKKYLFNSSIPAFNKPVKLFDNFVGSDFSITELFEVDSSKPINNNITNDQTKRFNNRINHLIIKFIEVSLLQSANIEISKKENNFHFSVIDKNGNLYLYASNLNSPGQKILAKAKKCRCIKKNQEKSISEISFIDYNTLCLLEQNSSVVHVLNCQKGVIEKTIDKKFKIVSLETNSKGWIAISAEDGSITIFNTNYPLELTSQKIPFTAKSDKTQSINKTPMSEYKSANFKWNNDINSATILSYRSSVICMTINPSFDALVCGTKDNCLLFSRLDLKKAKVYNSVMLKGRPQKLIITDGFGFVVVSTTKIKNGGFVEKLILYNINGAKIRSKKLDNNIRIVAMEKSLSLSSDLDFLIVADNNNYIYVFEAFYLQLGEPIFKCNSTVKKLMYIQEECLILAFCEDGTVSIIFYPIFE